MKKENLFVRDVSCVFADSCSGLDALRLQTTTRRRAIYIESPFVIIVLFLCVLCGWFLLGVRDDSTT